MGRVLLRFEAMPMDTLFFQRPDPAPEAPCAGLLKSFGFLTARGSRWSGISLAREPAIDIWILIRRKLAEILLDAGNRST
jgi:hypothetical protein